MSAGVLSYVKQCNAKAEAAKVIGEALQEARRILSKAGVDSPEDVISEIIDADGEE